MYHLAFYNRQTLLTPAQPAENKKKKKRETKETNKTKPKTNKLKTPNKLPLEVSPIVLPAFVIGQIFAGNFVKDQISIFKKIYKWTKDGLGSMID